MNSLTFAEIHTLHQQIAPLIHAGAFIFLKYIGERKYILEIGKFSILFCFQDPFLRFHLTKLKKNPEFNQFSDIVNKTLSLAQLKAFTIVNEDRILNFRFEGKSTYFLIAEMFPKKPNFYLLNSKMEIIESLKAVSNTIYTSPQKNTIFKKPLKSDLGAINSESVEKFYQAQELLYHLDKKKKEITCMFNAEIKQLLKQQETCKNSLRKALKWEDIKHEGELLQSNFTSLKRGMTEIIVKDWAHHNSEVTLTLNPKLKPQGEVEQRFKKAKKLKIAIEHYQRQLSEKKDRIKMLQEEIAKVKQLENLKELKSLYPEKKQADKTEKSLLPFREYISETGFKIWVGKNSSSNDALTFKYANGYDLWLHVKDYPGSHVIIRKKSNQAVDPATIDDAVQVAIFYSKAKGALSAEVCLTEKKYVSRFGKLKKGKVQISKQQVIHAKADKERFQRLKTAS
jgi:predicted ribosome quality control (RQC) complex YloA/Tae2 family protein